MNAAPLGVKTSLPSAHRARLDDEAAAFTRLDADLAELFDDTACADIEAFPGILARLFTGADTGKLVLELER
jgi:hypothetical protein